MSVKKKNQIDLLSRFLILAVVIVGFSIVNPSAFLSVDNLSQVIFQQSPFMILLAFGMSLAMISGGIDISMSSTMVLSSYLSASYFQQGNYLMGIVIAFGIGIAFGLFNGLLVSKVKIEPFIATFSVDFMALGLAYVACAGEYVYGFSDGFRSIVVGRLIPGIPNVALVTIIVLAILFFMTRRTIYGRTLYTLGHNKTAAKLSGMRSDAVIISVYVINGILAALTGVLYLARLNAADPSIRGTLTNDAIASALIGGIAFCGGTGTVVNTVIGSMIIMFIRNGMNIMGVSTNWQQAVVGFVILFAIIYERVLNNLMLKHFSKKD